MEGRSWGGGENEVSLERGRGIPLPFAVFFFSFFSHVVDDIMTQILGPARLILIYIGTKLVRFCDKLNKVAKGV